MIAQHTKLKVAQGGLKFAKIAQKKQTTHTQNT